MPNPNPSFAILLVEDDADTLDALATVINMKYPHVVLYTAISGNEGLDLFREHMPNLVITDNKLPELSGVQMAGKIRAIKPGAKIILLSADSGKTALDLSVNEGVEINHFIKKPVEFRLLFTTIEQCLFEIAQQI